MGAPQLLTEQYTPAKRLQVVEDVEGRLRARGPFADIGIPTKNGRRYDRPIWEKNLARLRPLLERNAVPGETDHPKDGMTSVRRISHMITDLAIVPGDDGVEYVEGELVVFSTPDGEILKTLIREGLTLGVSSRGRGTVKKDGNISVVQEDFHLGTFDVVVDPAASSAYPTFFVESEGQESAGPLILESELLDAPELTLATLRDKYPSLVSEIASQVLTENEASIAKREEQAKVALAAELVTTLRKVQSESYAQGHSAAIATKPDLQAPLILESIFNMLLPIMAAKDGGLALRVSEKDKQIASLTTENAQLKADKELVEASATATVTTASLALYLERRIQGAANFNEARAYVGQIGDYKSQVEIDTKLKEFVDTHGLKTLNESSVATIDALKAANAHLRKQTKDLAESVRNLTEQRDTAKAALSERNLDIAKSTAAAAAPDGLRGLLAECLSPAEVNRVVAAATTAPTEKPPLTERFKIMPGSLAERVAEKFGRSIRPDLNEASSPKVDRGGGSPLQEDEFRSVTGTSMAESLRMSAALNEQE